MVNTLAKVVFIDHTIQFQIKTASAKRQLEENCTISIACYRAGRAPNRHKELQIGPNAKALKELVKNSRRSIGYLSAA